MQRIMNAPVKLAKLFIYWFVMPPYDHPVLVRYRQTRDGVI